MQPLAAAVTVAGALSGSIATKDHLIQKLHEQVVQTINQSEKVPGLDIEVFKNLKGGILEKWNELVQKGAIEVTGTDAEHRPYFVALQAIVEHVLSHELKKSVKSLAGVIHTPQPATPLCAEGTVSPALVDATVWEDPNRRFTVNARTTIVRDYLHQGADLYIVYPKDGLAKRTPPQQEIYQKAKAQYPAHLFDCPLNTNSFANELVGAYYIFTNTDGKAFAFAIKITQANDPKDGSFGLWFGERAQPAIAERITAIHSVIQKDTAVQLPH